jgi:hypothetical protein
MKTSFEKFMASNAVQSVELSTVKVDLALIDDIEKKSKDVLQVTKDLNDKIEEFKKFKVDATLFLQGRTQQSVDLLSKLQDANKMANDLGMEFNISKYQSILDKYYAVTKQFDKLFK